MGYTTKNYKEPIVSLRNPGDYDDYFDIDDFES